DREGDPPPAGVALRRRRPARPVRGGGAGAVRAAGGRLRPVRRPLPLARGGAGGGREGGRVPGRPGGAGGRAVAGGGPGRGGGGASGGNEKVLVVDDSPTDLRLVALPLRVRGYEVTTAADGEEALAKAQSEHPRLIVLDVVLPKKNGFQVCRQLKTAPGTRDI